MENKEFFAELAKLIRSGASPDNINELTFDARRQTKMNVGYGGFDLNTLSSDLVVESNLRELAYFIDVRNDVTDKEYQEAKKHVAKRTKHAKGTPAQALCKLFEKQKLSINEERFANEFVSGAAKKLAKLGYKHGDIAEQPTTAFLAQSLAFFDENAEEFCKNPSPILPLVATAITARAMFDADQQDLHAIACANKIEVLLEQYIREFIVSGKAGNVKASTSNMVNQSVKMVGKLLWLLDDANQKTVQEAAIQGKRLSAIIPHYSKLDDKYKAAEKYLHDIALFRKLNETTQNPSQKLTNLDANSINELSYVGFAGDLVPVFKNSHKNSEELKRNDNLAKQNYTLALLTALAKNDGPSILARLSQLSPLEFSVVGLIALKYSGNQSEEAAQLAEALVDVYGEEKTTCSSFAQFSNEVKRIVEVANAELKSIRDNILPDLIASDGYTDEDKEAFKQIQVELAELENDLKKPNPFERKRPKTQEEIDAEKLRDRIEVASKMVSLTAAAQLKRDPSDQIALALSKTGNQFAGKLIGAPRALSYLIQNKQISQTLEKSMTAEAKALIDALIAAEDKDENGNDLTTNQVVAKAIAQTFEIKEDEIKQ